MTEQLCATEEVRPHGSPPAARTFRRPGGLLALALASLLAGPSLAATITISNTPFTPVIGTPDNFADFSACHQRGALSTDVGTFSAGGRAGGGGAVCGRHDSGQVRNGENYGRDGEAYLDSNDVSKLKWTLPKTTRAVQFVLQDVNDRPGTKGFALSAGSVTKTIGRQANGALNYVTVLFDANDDRSIGMHMQRGTLPGFDGFGLTAVTVTPAPVPLPASALLLAGGIGTLIVAGGLRRRRGLAGVSS